MIEDNKILSWTQSVCPVCLKRMPAKRVAKGKAVYLEKTCPEHGDFSVEVWGGHLSYEDWNRVKEPSTPVNPATVVSRGCPFDCGLCTDHRQHSCCVLLEVTQRCNLRCPICFASSGDAADDLPIETLLDTLRDLLTRGGPLNIQL
ncbi:MAG TPA: radical SAM protein, partial [Clostridia bacterium]|nr:radical SAM protein [Clostridia bacterium]